MCGKYKSQAVLRCGELAAKLSYQPKYDAAPYAFYCGLVVLGALPRMVVWVGQEMDTSSNSKHTGFSGLPHTEHTKIMHYSRRVHSSRRDWQTN